MNGEWLDLLREVGITEPPDWRDVIVVQNYVRGIARRPDHPWASRFNFVLLEGGSPRHFGKCRPLWDTAVERETAIRACLATCDSVKLRIPAARVAASERIRIQLGPFVAGSQYSRVTLRQSADEFLASVRTALSGAGELADLALASGLCETSPGDSIELCARAEQPLAFLAGRASFPDRLIDALRRAMADAGALPARPQHGDLWHRNLIVADDQLWAIDLEDYGVVSCPLHDDLTLLTSTLALRSRRAGSGVRQLTARNAGREAAACRGLLLERAHAEGVRPAQLDGILAYHVTHWAESIAIRAGYSYAAGPIDDARHVAERLAAGDRDLLLGAASYR